MKKYIIAIASVLILGVGVANAKNLTSVFMSIQSSIADRAELLYQGTGVQVIKIVDTDAKITCYVSQTSGYASSPTAISCVK